MPTPDEEIDDIIFNRYFKPYYVFPTKSIEEQLAELSKVPNEYFEKPQGKKVSFVQFDEYGNEVLLDANLNIIESDEN